MPVVIAPTEAKAMVDALIDDIVDIAKSYTCLCARPRAKYEIDFWEFWTGRVASCRSLEGMELWGYAELGIIRGTPSTS